MKLLSPIKHECMLNRIINYSLNGAIHLMRSAQQGSFELVHHSNIIASSEVVVQWNKEWAHFSQEELPIVGQLPTSRLIPKWEPVKIKDSHLLWVWAKLSYIPYICRSVY
jgi:hypothetical protein